MYGGCEVKQPLHVCFTFEDINDGNISIMTYLGFSNESVEIGPLSVCNFNLNFSNFFKSFVNLMNPKQYCFSRSK